MSHAGPSARDVAAFTSLSVAARKPRATSVRRSFLLWTAVEQKKQRSYASERPYEAHLLEAERALARGDALLIAAQADIEKDLKRTFPSLQGYGMLSEGATRNVLIAHAQRNPGVRPAIFRPTRDNDHRLVCLCRRGDAEWHGRSCNHDGRVLADGPRRGTSIARGTVCV